MTTGRMILVGIIGAPHGIKGDMRLKTFTGHPTAIGDYGPLMTAEGRRSFTVATVRPLRDDMVVARFTEISDRTAAEALTNTRLYVDRAAMPAPGEDEFYNADLVGLAVITDAGRPLGHVVGVANFGAGDLLEIAPGAGSSQAGGPPAGETLLVPFTKSFVPIVDLAGGGIVVAEGALMEGADEERPEDDR